MLLANFHNMCCQGAAATAAAATIAHYVPSTNDISCLLNTLIDMSEYDKYFLIFLCVVEIILFLLQLLLLLLLIRVMLCFALFAAYAYATCLCLCLCRWL